MGWGFRALHRDCSHHTCSADFTFHHHSDLSLCVAPSPKKAIFGHSSDSCEVLFPPLLYFMPGLGLQLYTFIYTPHLDWAQTEMFRIAALDDDWPPLCMFMLPVRGPLFRDNRRTQIIIPLQSKICFYYRRRVAMLLCTLMLPSDCLFIITAFLLSQRRPGQVFWGAKPFSCLFLSDIIVYSPKTHIHMLAPWLQPGWRTRCTRCSWGGVFWSWTPSCHRAATLCDPGASYCDETRGWLWHF